MVLRTCRSILRDEQAVEDSFQATFLVLVRRARSLWVRDSLGPWLYQVAVRVARSARSAETRRLRHEKQKAERTDFSIIDRNWDDLGSGRYTKSWPGCPKGSAPPWCSAAWRASRSSKQPDSSAGR